LISGTDCAIIFRYKTQETTVSPQSLMTGRTNPMHNQHFFNADQDFNTTEGVQPEGEETNGQVATAQSPPLGLS
jgi:hypothetical protein